MIGYMGLQPTGRTMHYTFLSDIDGTLLKTNMPLPDAVIRAASTFVSAGGDLSLCTGRAISATLPVARLLPISAPSILCSGSLIYDFEEQKVLYKNPLDASIHTVLTDILHREPAVSITVYTETEIRTIRSNRILQERGVMEDRNAPLCPLSEVEGDIFKILLTAENPETLIALGDVICPQFEYLYGSKHFYEITAKGVNKGTAMRMLAGLMDKEQNTFFVAGDAETDLAMREYAALFFAPVTAPDEVKRAADHIFPSPIEGGIAQALNKATQIAFGIDM